MIGEHPRFPRGIDRDVQLAIADEVDVTLAGWPLRKNIDVAVAITAYAENLDGFLPDDVRDGFREARKTAEKFAPTPTEVYKCVAYARRQRIERYEREHGKPEDDVAVAAPIPEHLKRAWRSALGGEPERKAPPVEYRDGKPVEPSATPITDVVRTLGPDVRD